MKKILSSEGVWTEAASLSGCGCGCSGLGAGPTVPWQCWDVPGFKTKHDDCFAQAQRACVGKSNEEECVNEKFGWCVGEIIKQCTYDAKACTSAENIKKVQEAIGVKADGKWGPASQAALEKTGKTFINFAGACTPPVPTAKAATTTGGGGTSGGKTVVSTPPVATPPTYAPPTQGSMFDEITKNPLLIGAVALVGVVIVGAIAKSKKKGKKS